MSNATAICVVARGFVIDVRNVWVNPDSADVVTPRERRIGRVISYKVGPITSAIPSS